jgi:hypothetical protein
VHVPEGRDQLADERIVQPGQQTCVEGSILLREGSAVGGHGDHLVDERRQFGVRGALQGVDDLLGHSVVERLTDLDDVAQRADIVTGAQDAAEDEGLDQGVQGHLAHIGSVTVTDVDDVECRKLANGFSHVRPRHSEAGAQLALGGQQVAGAQPVGEDEILDPVGGRDLPTGRCRLRHEHLPPIVPG